MNGGFKTLLYCTVVSSAIFMTGPFAEAFHSGGAGECDGCHDIHMRHDQGGTEPSKENAAMLRGSDIGSTCLACHQAPAGTGKPSGHYVATNDVDMPPGLPPSQLGPGGDFGYLKKTYSWNVPNRESGSSPGERHGHNIIAADFNYAADGKNVVAPGGIYPAEKLSCVSCHDPHADSAIDRNGAYRFLGGAGYEPKSSTGFAFTAGPPVAVAPAVYNRPEATTETRVAYGKGMSEWCSNCHRGFHDAATISHTHPAGNDVKLTAAAVAAYNAYIKTADLTGSASDSYTSLVPFEEGTDDRESLVRHATIDGSSMGGPDYRSNVMCLTCHRAHASAWDHATRWNMQSQVIVADGSYPGIDNGASEQIAQGRTAAETQRAFYDRPVELYARNQRSLCNKCHAKD